MYLLYLPLLFWPSKEDHEMGGARCSPQNGQSSDPQRSLAAAAGELGRLKSKIVPSGKNQTK